MVIIWHKIGILKILLDNFYKDGINAWNNFQFGNREGKKIKKLKFTNKMYNWMFFFFFWWIDWLILRYYLLTRLGSMELSVSPAEDDGGGGWDCCSNWHDELSTSPGSFFNWCGSAAVFSSLLLFWSEDVEGLDDAGAAMEMSSENIDISWSSSSRSNGGGAWRRAAGTAEEEELRHSSANGVSRKAMESLMDLRWRPRREVEKSRKSSTHEELWWAEAAVTAAGEEDDGGGEGDKLGIEGGGGGGGKWGQFWGKEGIFGGNWAIMGDFGYN